jgi:hypothetical protein
MCNDFHQKSFIRLSVIFVFGCITKDYYNCNTEAWHVLAHSAFEYATWEAEDFGRSGEETD